MTNTAEALDSEELTNTKSRIWSRSCLWVAVVSLLVLLPTAGDIGLTWDEPTYRYSQLMSAQWWGRLFQVRSWSGLTELLTPDTLHYYWPYGHFGITTQPDNT